RSARAFAVELVSAVSMVTPARSMERPGFCSGCGRLDYREIVDARMARTPANARCTRSVLCFCCLIVLVNYNCLEFWRYEASGYRRVVHARFDNVRPCAATRRYARNGMRHRDNLFAHGRSRDCRHRALLCRRANRISWHVRRPCPVDSLCTRSSRFLSAEFTRELLYLRRGRRQLSKGTVTALVAPGDGGGAVACSIDDFFARY